MMREADVSFSLTPAGQPMLELQLSEDGGSRLSAYDCG